VADHLTPEQLEQYRRGATTPEQLLAFDDHLSQCEQCRTALEKLVTPFALTQWAAGLARYENQPEALKETTAKPAKAPVPFRWPRLLWIPALATALLGILLWRHPDASKNVPAPPPVVAQLRDGSGTFQLDSNGVLHAPSTLDAPDQMALTEALKSRSLPLAAMPSDLAAPPGTLLGPSKPDEFSPLAPLSITVYTDRPQFRWQGLEGALTYELQIFDAEFRDVDASGKIQATEWTPVKPLARGALYQWQVNAYRAHDSTRTPTPPAPDARFRVLNSESFQKIEAARAMQEHFLAAILLAKAGMKEETRKEMDAVAVLNPGSELVKAIAAGLDH
jgi:hypothetical protein